MDIRPLEIQRDIRPIERIWKEVGWVDGATQAAYIKDFIRTGSCLVGCLDGTPECMVHAVPGTISYLERELSLSAVTAVLTSRVARRQGFARAMTARQLALAAEQGAQVAALGVFDQGFYDQVGFGTGAYENQFSFDPATLLVDVPFRVPSRLHPDDWREVHGALMRRLKHHGAVCLDPPELMKAELAWHDDGFGLGYYDGNTLTHFIWGEAKGEHGPYRITFMAYRSSEELLELLSLLRSLGDQVSSVGMIEPAHVQLQALLDQPFRNRRVTGRAEHENSHRACAWWQLRVLDVDGCVSARSWEGEPFQFNLTLHDPAAEFLLPGGWQGVGGDYTVRVAAKSEAQRGHSAGLPLLEASVNSFSRLLFGIASASELQASDGVGVVEPLLARLDAAFCLPRMSTSWDF